MDKKTIAVIAIVLILVLIGMSIMHRVHTSSQPFQVAGGLVAVSSDGTSIPPPADAAARLAENMAMQRAGDMNVWIAINPYPPTGFNPSDFEVTLTDA
jgi:hypothetical protein